MLHQLFIAQIYHLSCGNSFCSRFQNQVKKALQLLQECLAVKLKVRSTTIYCFRILNGSHHYTNHIPLNSFIKL